MKQSAKSLAIVLQIAIYLGVRLDIGFLIALTVAPQWMANYFKLITPFYVFCYTAGALVVWFLLELGHSIHTVSKGHPFTQKNVQALNRITIILALLLADFIYLMCFLPSLSKLLCIGLLILGVLCSQILAHLIAQAVAYREEIDLTI